MNIIEVIPISKGIGRESLSYFTAEDISNGSIVEVPVRNKKVNALVVSQRKVEDMKSSIKTASFTYKKVSRIKSVPFFLPSFIEASSHVATYHATTTGSTLHSIIPKALLEFAQSKKVKLIKQNDKPGIVIEKCVLQRPENERFDVYKSLIREEFAKKASLYFCLPTIEEAEKSYQFFKKGIENYTFLLHSNMKPSELQKVITEALSEKHPILIVGTGAFLAIPRSDINTYVLEKESSRFYKQMNRPFIDYRVVAELLAITGKKKVILGDSLLRTETIYRTRSNELAEFEPMSFRVFDSPAPEIIDMRKYKETSKPFRVLSEKLIDEAEKIQNSGGRMFLFGARRGLSPSIVCGDCGTSVTCQACNTAVVLHQSKNDSTNYFLCHNCGERRPAEERCKDCSSWKLITLGIGTELIEQEFSTQFPEATVLRFDKDSIKTEAQAKAMIKKFYESPKSVLIGTETALPYLTEPVTGSAIISFDSFFSLPDFRINEKITGIVLKLRSLSSQPLIIQSRQTENKALICATKDNLLEFYKEEIVLREKYGYPPFKTLIKITFDGKKPHLISELEKIHLLLAGQDFVVFPAFIKNQKGGHTAYVLLKTDYYNWPNSDLVSKIVSLPPSFTVKIDPDSIL